MTDAKEWLDIGQKFHGHKCPAMPMGLRTGVAALNALGVERTGDSALLAIVDFGENHCATCYGDGVLVITGCTFGKGNIQRTYKGKWALTLVNKKTKKAVRVTSKAEAMLANKKTSFFKDYREKGVPPTQVPDDVVELLVEKVMNAPQDMLLEVSDVFDYDWQEKPHSFSSFVCEEYGEMTVMEYGRVKGDKKVCIDCTA